MAAALGLTLALVSCASYGPQELRPGMAEAEVVARMGTPGERVAQAGGGTRLVYARGPMGRHTWMVDLGPDGRMVGWSQALGEAQFERIVPGMRPEAVRSLLGPPGVDRPVGLAGRRLWSWRYPTFECKLFFVTFEASGVVLDAGYGPDPDCEPDDYPS